MFDESNCFKNLRIDDLGIASKETFPEKIRINRCVA